MWIEIDKRLKPFSHKKGVLALVPGTSFSLQAFPCKLLFEDLLSGKQEELLLALEGPVHEFTLEIDCDKNTLSLFGKEQRGYFKFEVGVHNALLTLMPIRLFAKSLPVTLNGKSCSLEKGVPLVIGKPSFCGVLPKEKLFLGMSKALEIEKVQKREDLKEILPLWFALGQAFPKSSGQGGPFERLYAIAEAIKEKETLKIEKALHELYLGAIVDLFMPSLHDRYFQGLWQDKGQGSALALLSQGAELIRRLFVEEDEEKLVLLPRLLPSFMSGKMGGVELLCGSLLHLEWTKGKLRRVHIEGRSSRKIALYFSQSVKKCRLRESVKDRGVLLEEGSPLQLFPGKPLFLDRFQR